MLTFENDIVKLPEDLINQIKAGEVVERPYNVVKEITENSIDAGAKSIFIELLDGGKQLIRVTDDGCGIHPSQLELSLERHATSKIKNYNDLESLKSFGFRGEALPSIASVSQFSIKSRIKDSEIGYEINVNFGKKATVKECSMQVGTIVQIKDIFSAIPVRLKFLKSTAVEYSHIYDFLLAMAFSRFDISFKFVHNGREVFHYRAKKNRLERFSEIVGFEANEFTEVNSIRGSFSMSGFAGLPVAAKTVPRYFITFVNGRFVKDKIIRAGIIQAYQGLLLKGLVPSAVIFVNVCPTWLDVNVHPSKIEVRFYDNAVIQDLIAMGIQDKIKCVVQEDIQIPKLEQESLTENIQVVSPVPSYNSKSSSEEATQKTQNFPSIKNYNYTSEQRRVPSFTTPSKPIQNDDNKSFLRQEKHTVLSQLRLSNEELLHQNSEKSVNENLSAAKYLGQFSNCYLMLEQNSDLWIIDQHAFHERILFEEILNSHKNKSILKQELLTPYIISTEAVKSSILIENSSKFSSLGFDIEQLQNGNIAIRAYPSFLSQEKVSSIFEEIIAKILNHVDANSSLESAEVYHTLYATLACHGAVRSGDPLNEELVRRLLVRGEQVDFYAHCPHGRPVVRKFSQKDVSSWFQRI